MLDAGFRKDIDETAAPILTLATGAITVCMVGKPLCLGSRSENIEENNSQLCGTERTAGSTGARTGTERLQKNKSRLVFAKQHLNKPATVKSKNDTRYLYTYLLPTYSL